MFQQPALLLRWEALCLAIATLVAYAVLLHGSWLIFLLLFLVPDVSLIGYVLAQPLRLPAAFAPALYNLLHTYSIPLVLLLGAWHLHWLRTEQMAVIWISHIAVDRALGFGLKYPGSFRRTHMQVAKIVE